MAVKHYLPSKLGSYLKRLDLEYTRSNRSILRELINAAHFTVVEETSYDNWNGGTYGHDVILFLPAEIIGQIALTEQDSLGSQLLNDLNECAQAVDNENFRRVSLELIDESDPDFQRAVPLTQQPHTNPNNLSIWTPGHLRLFLSHRDSDKKQARRLADALSAYGISAFVAHDTIEPMTTWQREIEKGLETMEVMLAFVSDNFHDSFWTNQEIGYALGKSVPIITIKFGRRDPAGFIATKQALKGDFDRPHESAPAIYKLLADKLGQKGRLEESLISAFLASRDFDEARDRFDRMEGAVSKLNDYDVEKIQRGFQSNDQLHNSFYLRNKYGRLTTFLKKCTGKNFIIDGNELTIPRSRIDKNDEISF